MDNKKITSTTQIILIVICILIAVTASFLIGLYWGQKSYEDSFKAGYETAWQAAQKKLEDTGLAAPPEQEIISVSGTVIEIGENSFMIEASPVAGSVLDSAPIMRTIMVGDETVISKKTEKDPDELIDEQRTYDALIAGLGVEDEIPSPPSPYETETVGLSDLAVGQSVTVRAGKDIRNAATIDALEIDIYIRLAPETPAVGTTEEEIGPGDAPLGTGDTLPEETPEE